MKLDEQLFRIIPNLFSNRIQFFQHLTIMILISIDGFASAKAMADKLFSGKSDTSKQFRYSKSSQ